MIVDARRIEVARRAALVRDGLSNGGLVLLCDLEASPAPGSGSPGSAHAPGAGRADEMVLETGPARSPSRPTSPRRSPKSSPSGSASAPMWRSLPMRRLPGSSAVASSQQGVAPWSRLASERRWSSSAMPAQCGCRAAVSECTYVMASPFVRDAADERALAHALMSVANGARPFRCPRPSASPGGWSMVVDIDRGATEVGLGLRSGHQRGEERRSEGRGEA